MPTRWGLYVPLHVTTHPPDQLRIAHTAVPGFPSQQERASPNAQVPFTPLSALCLFAHVLLVRANFMSNLGSKGEEIDAAYDGRKATLQERRGKEGRAYGHTYNLPQSTPATNYSPSFHMHSTPAPIPGHPKITSN